MSKLMDSLKKMLDRLPENGFFELKKNGTGILTEACAGLTTFMAMAYILAVNPAIVSATGMPAEELFTATALASVIGTLTMGLVANLPYALAPGMGLNVFFVTVCVLQGYSWKYALFCVFVEGIIFMVLSLLKAREAVLKAIPLSLRRGISAGIGLLIVFVGLQNAGLIAFSEGSLVLGEVKRLTVLLAFFGIILVSVLAYFKVSGAMLISILALWGLGIGAQLMGLYVPGEDGASLLPAGILAVPTWVKTIGGACFDFKSIAREFSSLGEMLLSMLVLMFAFFYSDFFDTMGTLVAVAEKSGLKDENGNPVHAKLAFFSDALATSVGALLGTPTTTTYVESAAGVAQGGRTGLTAVFTAFFFLLSLFFSPVFLAIPSFAIAPVLIFVGIQMVEPLIKVSFEDASESVPALLAALVMPFTGSIANGIVAGVLSYTLINTLVGRIKKVGWIMWVLSVLFVLYFIFVK